MLFIEWNDGQQGIAREGEVLGDVAAAVAMAILLPDAIVALVVIAILDAPVFARGTPETRLVLCRDTGDEVPDVDVFGVRAVLFDPLPLDLDGAACREQPGVHGFERPHSGAADVDATVVTIATQIKKGVPASAASTALRRLEVLGLVPMR